MAIKRRYRWVLIAALFQGAMLAAFFKGFAFLSAVPTLLAALACTVGAVFLFVRRSALGVLLLCIGLGPPIFMRLYVRHVANGVRGRLPAYQAALPTVLELDAAHCRHPGPGSVGEQSYRCELHEFLPDRFKDLGQSVTVGRHDKDPVVIFQVLRGSRILVAHAPHWPAVDKRPYYSLGNGWHTTVRPPE